ncbi:MAG: 2-C-methyl-D-erythritol 4-phosphate cytidylyltransferase [Gammaproteobacteria bacterium]|nr:2-C-methyl-D-erythritol 4-phosphate cytidylyltransferase [Gammaproteobacteria bacterium]
MSVAGPRYWAVLPAAGIGSRMGADVPKQYLEVAGHTLLEHALHALLSCEQIAGVCVALHANDTRARHLSLMSDPRVQHTTGAAQRSGSVLAGLEALADVADDNDWILVHDAARPCLRRADIVGLLHCVVGAQVDGALLAEPLVDTVKQVNGDARITRTLDRSQLWRAQTPQMFRLGQLRDALKRAHSSETGITDEASAMELAGYSVQVIPCGAHNMKVTVPADLELAAFYLAQAAADDTAAPAQADPGTQEF